MDVHKSLLLANLKFLPEFEFINLEKFIEIYHFEEYLDKKTKDDLKMNLIKDINTLNRELNPNKFLNMKTSFFKICNKRG